MTTNRTISVDGLAIRYALASSIAPLRDAAIRHLRTQIVKHKGVAGEIATALRAKNTRRVQGTRAAYERFREDYPEIQRLHEQAKKSSA